MIDEKDCRMGIGKRHRWNPGIVVSPRLHILTNDAGSFRPLSLSLQTKALFFAPNTHTQLYVVRIISSSWLIFLFLRGYQRGRLSIQFSVRTSFSGKQRGR